MKTIIDYECEICGRRTKSKSDALECESKGVQKPFPIGMIFSSSFCGNKIVFCIIKQQKDGHWYHYSTWACRDTNVGDNFGGKEHCGLDGWDKDIKNPNKQSDAYKRMREGLIKKGIKPIDYKKGII